MAEELHARKEEVIPSSIVVRANDTNRIHELYFAMACSPVLSLPTAYPCPYLIVRGNLLLRLPCQHILRDGLMGCAQSQSFRASCSVAHPAVETAIKSSIAVVLYVRLDHRRLQPGILACRLTFFLPCCLANSTVPQPLDTQRGANHCWRLPVTASMDF